MRAPAMRLLNNILSALLLLAFTTLSTQAQENSEVPAALLASALNHATQSGLGKELLEKVYNKDVNALYQVAKSMYANPRQNVAENDKLNAVQIFHALADGGEHHILSMMQLGFAYSAEDKRQAVKYFVQAGEEGPHQGSLYNAGRLLAEEGEFAPALGFMRAAITLSRDHPEHAKSHLTAETAKQGYRTLSEQLQQVDLGLQEMVDMFPYADLNNFPGEGTKEEKLWLDAIFQFHLFGSSKKISDLEAAVKGMSDLQMQHDNEMSALQTSLLRRILVIALEKMNGEL
jgi:tetratricopeptide (TPR) repeat protein